MTDTRPLRPEVEVWGIRDAAGRPHCRQANDADMAHLGLSIDAYQPWSEAPGSSLYEALHPRTTYRTVHVMTDHRLEVYAMFAALGACCSCGEWNVVMKNGVDYRPDWAEHISSPHAS